LYHSKGQPHSFFLRVMKHRALRRVRLAWLGLALLLLGGGVLAAGPSARAQNAQPLSQPMAGLIISQYVNATAGNGFNKAIEIFNGTGQPESLSGYVLEIYEAGQPTPARTVELDPLRTLNNGETWVIYSSFGDQIAGALPQGLPAQPSTTLIFNGKSTLILVKNGVRIDSFGQRGVNPPSGWEGGGINVTGETLVRNQDVCFGRTQVDTPFDPSDEWTAIGQNNYSGLGEYTTLCGGGPPPGQSPVLNEFVIERNGNRSNQYIEIFGQPGVNYSNYTILVVRGDGPNPGVIERIYPVGVTSVGGYWTTPFLNNEITAQDVTFLLVRNLLGNIVPGIDIDANNDGFIDPNPPWADVADDVSVLGSNAVQGAYSTIRLTPNYDGRNQYVGGASRIPNGNTTQQASAWRRNYEFGGPAPVGLAIDTPNSFNTLGTATPTATVPSSTATPFPTAIVTPAACAPPPVPGPLGGNCFNILPNGGFETDANWIFGLDPVPGRIVGEPRNSGLRAALLGNPSDSGVADQKSYSSVRNLVTIPGDASTAFLRWATWERTEEGVSGAPNNQSDRHDVILLAQNLQPIEILQRSRCNYDRWYERQRDITQHRGRSVYVYFNAFNDGNGQRTWQNLDDVQLIVCYPEGVTPGPPTVAPPPVMPTFFPTLAPPIYPQPCAPGGYPQPCPMATDVFHIVTPLAHGALPTMPVIGASPTTPPVQEAPALQVAPIVVTATPTPPLPPTVPPPSPSTPLPQEDLSVPPTLTPVGELPATAAPVGEAMATSVPLQEPLGELGAPAGNAANGCTELVLNGDFEAESSGERAVPNWSATAGVEIERGLLHPTRGGEQALRIGVPEMTQLTSLSGAEQSILLPDNYASILLTFDYYLITDNAEGPANIQRADVFYMESGQLARRVLSESSDEATWLRKEEDLTALAGQPIGLRFSVADDGAGTAMYVDNVSILACEQIASVGSVAPNAEVVTTEIDSMVDVATIELERPGVAATATFPPDAGASNVTVVSTSASWWDSLTSSRMGTIFILICILLIILLVFWGLRTLFRPRR
jgi:hypothetical protein